MIRFLRWLLGISEPVTLRLLIHERGEHTYIILYKPGEESKVFRYLWSKRKELGMHGFAAAAHRVQEAIDG